MQEGRVFPEKNQITDALPSATELSSKKLADPDMGLTLSEVEERITAGKVNVSVDKTSKTTLQIVLSNVFTYFNIIFFVLAFILLIEGSFKNLSFLVVVFFNTAIGIFQEIRAKRTLERLTLLSAPLTKVVRDGREDEISPEELVLDDVIILEAGNQIPADAVICDGEINVNEALVTGESDEIKKLKGDNLLSGSFVVSGRCKARLEAVGLDSFISKLTLDAKKIKKKQQPGMMKSLTLLIKIIGIIIIPFSIIMYLNQQKLPDLTTKQCIENTAASVIGMIPEGLYLLTSVALALGVIRLAKKNTLVHDMKCIETLARVDMICVDKTGTITEPDMHLSAIVPLESEDFSAIESNIRDFSLNMPSDNATIRSIKQYFDDKGGYTKAERIKSFSSETKYSAARLMGVNYVLGAPEFVMREGYDRFRSVIEEHSSAGERVLLFAEYRTTGFSSDIFSGGDLSGVVIPLGLITLKNKVRADAKETFEYFTSQGVGIKVISGDNHITASKAAQDAGIPNADKSIDVSAITSKDKLNKAVLEYTVFGRVTPEQKRQMIKALKKAGYTVAMTGDGVNDVLALKDADCSIAMASGSDAAANVSDLVLLDSNFSSMPSVVSEGRRVINNIERSASLFLVKNIFSFLLTLISIFAVSLYPLKPAQISFVSLLFIGVPSFFLALEPNEDKIKGGFLRNVLFRSFPAAITAVIVVAWSLLFTFAFKIEPSQASTIAFYLYSTVAFLNLIRVCRPMNLLHKILIVLMGGAFVAAAWFIPSWFEISVLNLGSILVLTILMIIAIPLDGYVKYIFDNFGKWIVSLKNFIIRDIHKTKSYK